MISRSLPSSISTNTLLKIVYHFIISLVLLLGLNTPVSAHQSSTAYLAIQTHADHPLVNAEYRLAIRDLALLLPLDADNNQKVTWGEIKQQQTAIVQLLNQDLQWKSQAQACRMNALQQPLALDRLAGMTYLVAYLSIDCGEQALTALNYQVLAQIDDSHRLLMSLNDAAQTTNSHTWLVASGETSFDQTGWWATIKTYLNEGVHHILTGYDHLLFLLCLLLPSVYIRQQKQWVPVQSAGIAIKHIVYIATAFTVAHSITLCLAALNIVSIPARWIESAIAFSIALAALNNLFPLFASKQIRIAFFFGLIHGFGFANVLSDLPLALDTRILALLSYNLGIELGQLGCILIFLPIALGLRYQAFYRRVLLQGGSIVACILALLWMTQRLFGLNWIAG
jgi:hydrogenase/urease accessory protein HupE